MRETIGTIIDRDPGVRAYRAAEAYAAKVRASGGEAAVYMVAGGAGSVVYHVETPTVTGGRDVTRFTASREA